MVTYLWYTLKVSACLVVFYTFYITALRNSTFFVLNRLYLVVSLILSFVIPVLQFSIFKSQSNAVITTLITSNLIEPESVFYQPINQTHEIRSINYTGIVSVIYIVGASILFFRLLFSILGIVRIKKNSETHLLGKLKIVKTNSLVPFSFLNMIFLPKHESNELIIEHEKAHITQLHWFDLLITEIASVLLWFNPFVVLYKRSLKLQHEYLADYKVIRNNNQMVNYLACLFKQVQNVSIGGPVSQFNCKTIKQRIIMITKNKTSVKYLGIYLLVIPLVCFLLFAFTTVNYTVMNIAKDTIVPNIGQCRPNGNPLKVKEIIISADYGMRLSKSKEKVLHGGIDIKALEGQEVISTFKGMVIKSEYGKGTGNYVLIKHSDSYSTLYSHLKGFAVKMGDKVEKGQVIGYVGKTGSATGFHLHYEVLKDGKKVDPKDYLPK